MYNNYRQNNRVLIKNEHRVKAKSLLYYKKRLEDAEEILKKITGNANPVYLRSLVREYFDSER